MPCNTTSPHLQRTNSTRLRPISELDGWIPPVTQAVIFDDDYPTRSNDNSSRSVSYWYTNVATEATLTETACCRHPTTMHAVAQSDSKAAIVRDEAMQHHLITEAARRGCIDATYEKDLIRTLNREVSLKNDLEHVQVKRANELAKSRNRLEEEGGSVTQPFSTPLPAHGENMNYSLAAERHNDQPANYYFDTFGKEYEVTPYEVETYDLTEYEVSEYKSVYEP
jgi:hypothetical protein